MANQTIFHFKKTGLLTTIQDDGRSGHQAFGVPVGGSMDNYSANLANQLVGNPPNHPVLEITLFGPTLRIEGEAVIALTGANLSPKINGKSLPMYQTFTIKNGDELTFGQPQNGCRAYLAVAGDWQVKKWLNSASAAAQNGAILTPDSIFRNGSQLKITPQRNRPEKVFPKELRPNFPDLVRIQVLKGPEYEQFTAEVRQQFFGKIHQVSQQSNRMGYRLDKNLVGFAQNSELISSGVIPGTIQITNAGQPIILMRDAQTTGGYWRLGNVISEDLNKLAQLKPGDSVWFSLK